jgi:hypothetical protein
MGSFLKTIGQILFSSFCCCVFILISRWMHQKPGLFWNITWYAVGIPLLPCALSAFYLAAKSSVFGPFEEIFSKENKVLIKIGYVFCLLVGCFWMLFIGKISYKFAFASPEPFSRTEFINAFKAKGAPYSCTVNLPIRKCSNLTEAQCLQLFSNSALECVKQFESSVPDRMSQAVWDEWEKRFDTCLGQSVDPWNKTNPGRLDANCYNNELNLLHSGVN